MTNLFLLHTASLVVPLLFPSWRVAVLGLGLQGVILALVLSLSHEPGSTAFAAEFAALLVIRGLFVPWYLFRQSREVPMPEPFVLIEPSLWPRALALGLVGLAFALGNTVAGQDRREALQVGTAASGILVGMLLIANQRHHGAQLVGLFTFEGGVTMVELLSPHPIPFPVQLGVNVIDLLFVVTCGRYLARLAVARPEADTRREVEL